MFGITTLVLTGSLFYVIVKGLLSKRKLAAPYPPGPKGLPLLGNTFDFPTADIAREYVEWGKKYGSRFLHGSALGTHVVILNSRIDADELLERRASKYSDRPQAPLVKMTGLNYNFGILEYGKQWRLCRRISQQTFRQAALNDFTPIITQKVHHALVSILESPEKFEDHNKMLSISIPMSAMYGYDVKSSEDPCIAAADQSIILSLELIAPGGSLINVFPFLRFVPPWFPGASSRKKAALTRNYTDEMLRIPLEFVKSQMSKGIAKPSFISNFFEKKSTSGASEEEEAAVLSIAPTVYAGASDTTISATGTFIYLMTINPNIQKKAQAEIDLVIGSKRLPTFEDRPLMPYLEAIYREVLRWKPPVQLGVPHATTEDDIYEGYFIPKGSTVITNLWAMAHDESLYPDPHAFKPERFINPDGTLNKDDRILAFGFGRRICVGKHVGSATLWLTIVSMLSVFDFSKARDELGKEIGVNDEYHDFGFVIHKTPFECSITPRSPAAELLIEQLEEN